MPQGHWQHGVMATDVFFPEQEHLQVILQPCNYNVLQSELAEMLNPNGLIPSHCKLVQLHLLQRTIYMEEVKYLQDQAQNLQQFHTWGSGLLIYKARSHLCCVLVS